MAVSMTWVELSGQSWGEREAGLVSGGVPDDPWFVSNNHGGEKVCDEDDASAPIGVLHYARGGVGGQPRFLLYHCLCLGQALLEYLLLHQVDGNVPDHDLLAICVPDEEVSS